MTGRMRWGRCCPTGPRCLLGGAALLDEMQQMVHEKAIYSPIWRLGFLNGVGPRVGESPFATIPGFAYTAPFENLTIEA